MLYIRFILRNNTRVRRVNAAELGVNAANSGVNAAKLGVNAARSAAAKIKHPLLILHQKGATRLEIRITPKSLVESWVSTPRTFVRGG